MLERFTQHVSCRHEAICRKLARQHGHLLTKKEDRINERIGQQTIRSIRSFHLVNLLRSLSLKAIAFRMMHPMGRMHITLHMRHSDDMDTRFFEKESSSATCCSVGTGDAHCNDELPAEAVQERVTMSLATCVSSSQSHSDVFKEGPIQRTMLRSVSLNGRYHNDDAYHTQPFLPDGRPARRDVAARGHTRQVTPTWRW